ncbi:hypothetical protein, partial [Tannerella forsythia]
FVICYFSRLKIQNNPMITNFYKTFLIPNSRNILDIDGYSQKHLIELIDQTQANENYLVCVSPYIDAIKTERLEVFKRHFENAYESFKLLLELTNNKSNEFWCCNNTYTRGSINHGDYFNCKAFDDCGCSNRWTRIIKVFKLVI